MASGSGKAKASSWAAAMSVGTVEALKDQAGLCRWNYAFRQAAQQQQQQQRARRPAGSSGSGGSGGSGSGSSASGCAAAAAAARRKAKQQEEELRTVMYLSNWGPNN